MTAVFLVDVLMEPFFSACLTVWISLLTEITLFVFGLSVGLPLSFLFVLRFFA